MKIDSAVLAVLERAGSYACGIFCERGFNRPNKWMNGTKHEGGRFFVPAGITQSLAAIGCRMRFKRPRRVGTEFGRDAKSAEDGL